jgi:hypothetical protein
MRGAIAKANSFAVPLAGIELEDAIAPSSENLSSKTPILFVRE